LLFEARTCTRYVRSRVKPITVQLVALVVQDPPPDPTVTV
jgi:hypothetical protein